MFSGDVETVASGTSEETPFLSADKRQGIGIDAQASATGTKRKDSDDFHKDGNKSMAVVPKDLSAFHIARFLASFIIVLKHFYKWPATGPGLVWSSSFISFFFALSGFGPTHSKILRSGIHTFSASPSPSPPTNQDPYLGLVLDGLNTAYQRWVQPRTFLRRLVVVYPLYFIALMITIVVRWKLEHLEFLDMGTGVFVQELTLTQMWLWPLNKSEQMYNVPAWYISALSGCWLFEAPLFDLAALTYRTKMIPVAVMGIAAWVLLWPFAMCPVTWGHLPKWHQVPALMYLHEYFVGVLLAFVFHHRVTTAGKEGIVAPWGSRWFASAAALVLLLLFLLVDMEPYGGDEWTVDHWFKKVGLLLPVHSVLILGLAEGNDPLSKLFSSAPLVTIGSTVAYGTYILQGPIIESSIEIFNWHSDYNEDRYKMDLQPHRMAIATCILLVSAALLQQINKPLTQYLNSLLLVNGRGKDATTEGQRSKHSVESSAKSKERQGNLA